MNNSTNLENLDWYHTIELQSGHITKGRYDWRPYLKYFDFGNLDGKKVLDIGCGSGFFSFHFETLGASVTALDIPSQEKSDYCMVGEENVKLQSKCNKYTDHKNAFSIAADMLNSNVKRIEIDLYDITPKNVGVYDLIFCNDVLLHLTDPFKALNIFKKVCGDTMIIGTPIYKPVNPFKKLGLTFLKNEPISYFMGDTDNGAFWIPSTTCLKSWIIGAGFKIDRTYDLNLNKKHNECVMPRLIVKSTII